MKKILTGIGVLSLFVSTAMAQSFDPTGDVGQVNTYSVINMSQKNADAQNVGAREGDLLRYEFKIQSDKEDVVNFVTSIDVTSILQNADIIDMGLGNLTGNTLTFPSFTQQAPCIKVFTFTVRLKKCSGKIAMTSSGHGLKTIVPLSCGLVKSGPSVNAMWYGAIAVLLGFIMIGFFNRRSQS